MPPHDPANAGSHDVVIGGGGMYGASRALALGRGGLDVAMVEGTPAARRPEVFDQRNLSFAGATTNALTALGVMQKLRAPTGPIRRIHVSRRGDFGSTRLEAGDYGRETFGQVVVARDFGEAREARLAKLERLTRYRPARFIGLGEVDGGSRGIRIADLHYPKQLEELLRTALDYHNFVLTKYLGVDAVDFQQTYDEALAFGEYVQPMKSDVAGIRHDLRKQGKRVLFEEVT